MVTIAVFHQNPSDVQGISLSLKQIFRSCQVEIQSLFFLMIAKIHNFGVASGKFKLHLGPVFRIHLQAHLEGGNFLPPPFLQLQRHLSRFIQPDPVAFFRRSPDESCVLHW